MAFKDSEATSTQRTAIGRFLRIQRSFFDQATASERRSLIESVRLVIDRLFDLYEKLPEHGPPPKTFRHDAFNLLPRAFRNGYTKEFVRNLLVLAVSLGQKLGSEVTFDTTCTAEEILLSRILDHASKIARGKTETLETMSSALFQDWDFEFLFNEATANIGNSPVGQHMHMANMSLSDWFKPFGNVEAMNLYFDDPCLVGKTVHRRGGYSRDYYGAQDPAYPIRVTDLFTALGLMTESDVTVDYSWEDNATTLTAQCGCVVQSDPNGPDWRAITCCSEHERELRDLSRTEDDDDDGGDDDE